MLPQSNSLCDLLVCMVSLVYHSDENFHSLSVLRKKYLCETGSLYCKNIKVIVISLNDLVIPN